MLQEQIVERQVEQRQIVPKYQEVIQVQEVIRNVPVEQIIEEIVEVPKIIYQEQIVERQVEQRQIVPKYVEVPQIQKRVRQEFVEQIVEQIVEVPQIQERVRQ